MANISVMNPLVYRSPSPTITSQRQSLVSSSAASFHTAKSTSSAGLSHSASSRSSSVHTVGPSPNHRDSENVNSIHTLGIHAQEVHIVKVTGDAVHVEAGSVADSFLQTLGKSLAHVVPPSHTEDGSDDHIGPLPPSPPASVEQVQKQDDLQDLPMEAAPRLVTSKSDYGPRLPTMTSLREHQPSTGFHDFHSAGPSNERGPLPSLNTKLSSSTSISSVSTTRPSKTWFHPDNTTNTTISPDTPSMEASGSRPSQAGHLSADGYLQPPSLSRPTRRYTTGSSPRSPIPMHRHAVVMGGSQPISYDVADEEGELANDIQLQAEQIRRERMSKRAKAQQAEAALTRQASKKEEADNNVLVGNLIGEDHVNYVLMYNMLTGIRIGVSRCQAKIKRPLTDDDFTARHKFSFDIVGNELTPSARYDFKFKDYAPWVFRELREDHFQLDPADYLLSLTAQYILSELGSPGKSGSFFYFSRDYRFIIKTIRHSEHKFLLSILKDYHAHVKNNPHTLLSRFYGLHRVKLPHGRKIHFVIMNNLFPPHRDIHETYDLKGSTVGREYSEEKAAANPRAVLKDLNWINRGKMLELGPEKRALLTEQLRRDAELLRKINVMDYSLLVGIHNMQRGNRDNVRKNTLKVFSPDIGPMRRKNAQLKGSWSPEAIAMRRAMRESDPKRLGKGTIRLPNSDTGDRQQYIFYQDEGGLRATDEGNDPMDTIYYLGVIDILTPYSVLKKLEHFWKGLRSDRHKISPVPPDEYADRFFAFIKAVMRGGGGGGRFKSE